MDGCLYMALLFNLLAISSKLVALDLIFNYTLLSHINMNSPSIKVAGVNRPQLLVELIKQLTLRIDLLCLLLPTMPCCIAQNFDLRIMLNIMLQNKNFAQSAIATIYIIVCIQKPLTVHIAERLVYLRMVSKYNVCSIK